MALRKKISRSKKILSISKKLLEGDVKSFGAEVLNPLKLEDQFQYIRIISIGMLMTQKDLQFGLR